jgi:hypothetical protein
MRFISKLHLVQNKGNASQPISALSVDEQVHLLDLADTALHNKKLEEIKPQAGSRAWREHQRLKQELKHAVEWFERNRK